jgi:hypothetical protein
VKQLETCAANFLAVFTEGKKVVPEVEVCLVTSEPEYGTNEKGEVVKKIGFHQFRFVANPAVLRKAAELLCSFADESQKIVEVQP